MILLDFGDQRIFCSLFARRLWLRECQRVCVCVCVFVRVRVCVWLLETLNERHMSTMLQKYQRESDDEETKSLL